MVKAPADPDLRAQEDLSKAFWGRSDLRADKRAAGRVDRNNRSYVGRSPRRRPRRGRTFAALVVVAALIGTVIAGGWWWRSRSPKSDSAPSAALDATASTPVALAPVPTQPAAVIAHQRSDNRLDWVAVVGTDGVGERSAVLFIPTTTQIEVPAIGLQQVAELQRLGGLPVIDLAVRNTLGVATDRSAILDDAALAAMFEPAGPLLVTLRRPVAIAQPPLQLAMGSQTISPSQAAALMVGAPTDMSELDRLDVVRTVMLAWMEALRNGDRGAVTAQRVPAAAPLVAAARPTAQVETIPVDTLTMSAEERYQVRTSEVPSFMERALPDALYRTGTRPRIELRGSDDVSMLQAGACIIRAGGNIRLTGRGQPADTTSVVFYRERGVETARQMLAAVRTGSLKRADRDLDLVDVTVEIGKDFNGCS
ncbi:MAG: hypothetical protein ACOYN3_09960 [Acidimicrobiia bacterium]